MYTIIAMKMLESAGYRVTPTNIPGLWDVHDLARDVTLGQLRQLAEEHGKPWSPIMPGSSVKIQNIS